MMKEIYEYRLDIKTGTISSTTIGINEEVNMNFPKLYANTDHYGVFLDKPDGLKARQLFLEKLRQDIGTLEKCIESLTRCV
ncbi:MAG: hypothetical protein IKO54_08720 [Lachnospiraceae bacterium]|nr:hypothetical protein [Lachnospiraceae bacterium]